MYLISLTYKKPISEIEKYLEDHVHFLDAQYAANTFIFSGRKNPRTGGVILAYNVTKEALDDLLKEDPFYQHQLADYEITEIIPTKYAEQFACFITQK